jgi:preprotein translocase subunit SecA
VLEAVAEHYEKREQELTSDILRQLERYILLNAIDAKWKDHLRAIDSLKAGIGLRGYGQVDPKTEYKREGFQLFERLLHAVEDEVTSLILRIQVRRPEESNVAGAAPAAPAVPAPKGIAAPSAAAMAADARMRAAAAGQRPRQYVPVSRAFDVAKRRQQAMEAMQAREKAAGTPGAPAGTPAADPNAAGAGNGNAPAAGAPAAAVPQPRAGGSQPQHVPSAGRNDPCPCGSGQKYKKCHGKNG